MTDTVLARLYRCPECGYQTPQRWILKNHLYNVHSYKKRDAIVAAMENEYQLNPTYRHVSEIDADD